MSRRSANGVVLLDLDGTLVDPAVGIIGSLVFVLHAMGRETPDDLRWVIGPPIRESLRQLLGADGDVARALALYRERYAAEGLCEARVYDGIPEALAEMAGEGRRLLLCTSKAIVFAERVLIHFGLSHYFAAAYGAELDGRFEDKGQSIARILAVEELDAPDVCMVGDRRHDVAGALRHRIPTLGATWGYGSVAELREAGAATLCASPADLPAAVRALRAAAAP